MKRTLQPVSSIQQESVAVFIGRVSGLMDLPWASIRFSVGGEVGDVRRINMQVVDRTRDAAVPGQFTATGQVTSNRFVVRIWISTAAFGAPGGADAIAVATGTLLSTIVANQYIEVLTDASGVASVDVTKAGVATLHAQACVTSEVETTGPLAWA